MSNCAACTADAMAEYHAARGDDAEACRLVDTVIGGGLSCASEPHASLGTALLPYLRRGRLADAREAHLKGYRLVRGQLVFQDTLADHLRFLALTGNEARGLEVLDDHRSMLTQQQHPHARLRFLAAAGLLLRRAAAVLTADTLVTGPDGATTAEQLAGWCRAEALVLAAAFDLRNGTGRQTEVALAVLDADPLVGSLRLGLAPASEPARAEAVPVGVTAELIGAEGLDVTALAAHAEELALIGHPATGALWRRVAELAGPDADPALLAAIDDGIGRDLAGTDPFGSRERLVRAVERWAAIGDERKLVIARSRAAVAAALAGAHDEAVAECEAAGAVIAELGTPTDQLHHRHRWAYVRLASAVDDAGRAEAAALFREHAALADELGATADAAQSRIILLDRLDEPSDPDAAAAAWQDAVETARAVGREWWLPHLSIRLAQSRLAAGWYPDRLDAVLATLADAVRYGDEWGEDGSAAYASYLRAELLTEAARYDEARGPAFDAVVRAEDTGAPGLVTDARILLGTVYHELERDHEAVQFLETALPALPEDDHAALYRVRYRLGVSLRRLGENRDAATHLAVASEIAERAGVAGSAAHAANLVGVALEQVEPVAAATAFARAARLFVAADEELGAVRMHRARAATLAEAGHYDDALTALTDAATAADALEPAEGVDPRWERAEVDDQSARVLAVAGRGVEAVQRALSAEQRHREVGAHSDAAYAAALAAQVTLELLEDAAAAEPVARRAVAHAEASDDESARTAAAVVLADVLDGQERGEEADELRRSVGLEEEDQDQD
jgi:tetratricopeptide (TPR) repeat protein